jgi:hypothetical protein
MKTALEQVTAPNLPLAPESYAARFIEQLNNVLRLYFTRLGGLINSLTGVRGGQYLNFPYAAIQRTTDVTFTANTATQITFDQNDYVNGCVNDGTDGIAVGQSGLYNYQFSVQFTNSDSQIHSAWVWLRKNNADVLGTASKFDVTSSHGGVDGAVIGAANFYIDAVVDDTIELWAAVSNVAVKFHAEAAQTSPFAMPAIPSVVATLTFVSQKD